MRALIISSISLVLLIIGWTIFSNYTDKNTHALMDCIENNIIISVQDENWDSAAQSFHKLSDQWHKNKKVYSFFLDTKDINNTDYSIARAKAYIAAENKALSTGELSAIKEQLKYLHSNELVALENIL